MEEQAVIAAMDLQAEQQDMTQKLQPVVFASDDSSMDGDSAYTRQVSHMSSTFDFDGEEADDRIYEMRTHEISYPVQQPRSLSFLRSRNYPDAEIHAETNSARL